MRVVSEVNLTRNNGAKAGLFATAAPIATPATPASTEDVVVAPPKRGRRYQARGRRYLNNGNSRTARRAFTAATRYLAGEEPSLRVAADSCRSTPAYVSGMVVILQSRNALLLYHVLHGDIRLPAAAKLVKNASIAIQYYAKLSSYELQLFEDKTGAIKDLNKHIAASDLVEAAAALIKAAGSIDATVDLLIAAKPVAESVVESVAEPTAEELLDREIENA